LTSSATYDILVSSREGEDETMTDWYENPEIHAEEYEELMALMAEEAEG